MNDTGDVYTPELKIKYFLDSMTRLLLVGNTNGIETPYRQVMHAKREIPVSNCTSDVENVFYASGVNSPEVLRDEKAFFNEMLEKLDERAEVYEVKKEPRKKERSLFGKKLKLGIPDGEWYRVDTEGRFQVGEDWYQIDDREAQYLPIPTEYGAYYAMDKILLADGHFYDMNYDEVVVYRSVRVSP